jgi:hypothetical protein
MALNATDLGGRVVGVSRKDSGEKEKKMRERCGVQKKERGGFLVPLAAKRQLFDNPIFCRITYPDLITN